MQGRWARFRSLYSYVSIEERFSASHTLRRIGKLADLALDRLNPTFCELYTEEGWPSMQQQLLLLAPFLQAFYGIYPERLLLAQFNYNLLSLWLA
jgi:hypothetical protein